MLVLFERGVFFYTRYTLNKSDAFNLSVAMGFGLCCVIGSLSAHRLCAMTFERRFLTISLLLQLAVCVMLSFRPFGWVLVVGLMAIAIFASPSWPVIERYVSAGRSPRDTSRAIGWFNMTWGMAVPLVVMVSGLLIKLNYRAMFILGAVMMPVALLCVITLPRRAAQLSHDHPLRVPAGELPRYRRLILASRWMMFLSYALVFVLGPLLPGIFKQLGFDVEQAALLSSPIDWSRFVAFVVMYLWVGWHNRMSTLVLCMIAMPLGFLLTLYGPNTSTVVAGQIIFGATTAVTYYTAIYYAMVVHDASVRAGGWHESVIGAGLFAGPALALMGSVCGDWFDHHATSYLVGTIPMVIVCTVGAVRALTRSVSNTDSN